MSKKKQSKKNQSFSNQDSPENNRDKTIKSSGSVTEIPDYSKERHSDSPSAFKDSDY